MKRITFIAICFLLNISAGSPIQAMVSDTTSITTQEQQQPTLQIQLTIQVQNTAPKLIPCAGFPNSDNLKTFCQCHNDLAKHQGLESIYPIGIFQNTLFDCLHTINYNIASSIKTGLISTESTLKTIALLKALHERTQNNDNFSVPYSRKKIDLPCCYAEIVGRLTNYLSNAWRPVPCQITITPMTAEKQSPDSPLKKNKQAAQKKLQLALLQKQLFFIAQKEIFQHLIDQRLELFRPIAHETIEKEMSSIIWGEPTEEEEQETLRLTRKIF